MKNTVLGASGLAIADLVSKAAGFVIIPFLVNSLSVSDYGALTIYLACIQVGVIVISFCGQGLLPFKYIHENEEEALLVRKNNLALSGAFAAALVLPIVFVGGYFDIELVEVLLILGVSFLQGANAITLSYFRISQTYKSAILGQIFNAALSVLLTIALFYMVSPSVNIRLLSIFISYLLVQFLFERVLYFKCIELNLQDVKSRMQAYKEIVRYGLTLVPHHASYWVKSSVDKFFVLSYFSISDVGVYGLATQLSSILILSFSILSQAYQPFIYRYLKNGDVAKVKKMNKAIIFCVVFISLVFVFLISALFDILFSVEYIDSLKYLKILALGAVFHGLYTFSSHILFFSKNNKEISKITFASMLLHVFGLIILSVLPLVYIEGFCFLYVVSSGVAFFFTYRKSEKVLSGFCSKGGFI